MHALAAQSIQISGEGGDQGLAFACLHLSDTALMEHDAADQLHGEMPHAQHPVARFTNRRKGFREDIVHGLPGAQALLELGSFRLQLLVGELAVFLLQSFDLRHRGHDLLDFPAGTCAKEFRNDTHIL